MRREFKLPDVGEGIAEAEIVEYLVKAGDAVTADQPVVRIETDKAVVELPCPVSGTVAEVPFKSGDTVKVGETLLVIETEAKGAKKAAPHREEKEPRPKPELVERRERETPVQVSEAAQVLATPHTRKLARELHVDIGTVKGTGAHGRITDEDVRKAAEKGEAAPREAPREEALQEPATAGFDFEKYGPTRRVPLKGVRKRIAEVMVRSVTTVPHVTHFDEADVTELMAVVEREKALAEKRGIKLTVLSFLAKAVAAALLEFPSVNSSLDDESGELVYKDYINIGIATDTEAGLMVPVIRDVDRKSILQIAAALQELSRKARERRIDLEELRGGTFTITNVGAVGGKYATPIILHPQVAILCSLRAEPRPVVQDDQIVIRTMMPLTLSFDHRVLDGAEAGRFTNYIVALLKDPMRMLVDVA